MGGFHGARSAVPGQSDHHLQAQPVAPLLYPPGGGNRIRSPVPALGKVQNPVMHGLNPQFDGRNGKSGQQRQFFFADGVRSRGKANAVDGSAIHKGRGRFQQTQNRCGLHAQKIASEKGDLDRRGGALSVFQKPVDFPMDLFRCGAATGRIRDRRLAAEDTLVGAPQLRDENRDNQGVGVCCGSVVVRSAQGPVSNSSKPARAASCSAIFLLFPSPSAVIPATLTCTLKVLLWSGPLVSTTRYSGISR